MPRDDMRGRGNRLRERSAKIPGGLLGGMERAAKASREKALFGAIGSGMAQSSNIKVNKPTMGK